jgi:cysteinyl-tRNA synthetase
MELGSILGLCQEQSNREELSKEVQYMIEERTRARKNKDWKKADEIRERLRKMGFILKDYPTGTTWTFEREE